MATHSFIGSVRHRDPNFIFNRAAVLRKDILPFTKSATLRLKYSNRCPIHYSTTQLWTCKAGNPHCSVQTLRPINLNAFLQPRQ